MKKLWSHLRDQMLGRKRDGVPAPVAPPAGPQPPAGGEPSLHYEGDIVTDDLGIDIVKLASIAAHRAGLEYDRYVAAGMQPPKFTELYDDEAQRLRKMAAVMIECRQLRRELDKLPPEQRFQRQRDLQEYIRKYGLGGYR